jgi:AdoMet-dependent rRNA methyltransferase SPB1
MFRLKAIDQTEALRRIAKGKMAMLTEAEAKKDRDSGIGSSGETDDESDEEADRLERELDSMYDQYRERKAAADAKYRAKKARQEHDDEEWEGVSADEGGASEDDDDDDEALEEDSSDDSDAEERGDTSKPLLRDLANAPQDGTDLSKRARGFFSQDIFQSIPGLLDVPEEEEEAECGDEPMADAEEASEDDVPTIEEQKKLRKEKSKSKKHEERNGDFEVLKRNENDDDDWEETEKKTKDGRPSKCDPSPANSYGG